MTYSEKFRPQQDPEYLTELDELEAGIGRIWDIAEEFGLDPFPTHFEIVPPDIMSEMGAYGVPGHFHHWTYGRIYRVLKTQYDHGLMRIYEMVVNSDPSQAFLLDNNPLAINLKVAAHVNAHVDFFKNNFLFKATRRDMPTTAGVRAQRLREYEERYGAIEVEQLLDACMTVAEHIEPGKLYRPTPADRLAQWKIEYTTVREKPQGEFDEILSIGTPASNETPKNPSHMPFPLHPDKDILGFMADFSPHLEDWQRDVIAIVREESYYFYPQARTKIMNEGWATFWHVRIMHEMEKRDFITPSQAEEWWISHQGVASPRKNELNPYFFGYLMFDYLADYYNGRLKPEENAWLEANGYDIYPRFNGDFAKSPGLKEIRRIMAVNDDASFIANYFNAVVARRMNAYLWTEEEGEDDEGNDTIDTIITSTDWEDFRDFLVQSKANNGQPYIVVKDANFEGRHELLLEHRFDGRELLVKYIEKTLPYLYYLWQRPVHLTTVIDGYIKQFSYDGKEVTKKNLRIADSPPPFTTKPV